MKAEVIFDNYFPQCCFSWRKDKHLGNRISFMPQDKHLEMNTRKSKWSSLLPLKTVIQWSEVLKWNSFRKSESAPPFFQEKSSFPKCVKMFPHFAAHIYLLYGKGSKSGHRNSWNPCARFNEESDGTLTALLPMRLNSVPQGPALM